MLKKTRDVAASIAFAIALAVLAITFSIGLPIYVRPFYYLQVNALDLPERTGYEYEEIIDAYDEVLDYLTLEGREFGTGSLKYSEEGKAHFVDCKVLFDLNRNAFVISMLALVLLIILDKYGHINLLKPRGIRLGFWSFLSTLAFFGFVAIACAIDFSSAFTAFHKLFFPGKSNWLFNPYTDPIILVLPQQFFLSCAVLICVSVLLISALTIVFALVRRDRDYIWRRIFKKKDVQQNTK